MPREPQSYGSGSDWVTGRTDQKVNDPKSTPAPEHQEFYDERRESETSSPAQGGQTSDFQLADSAQPTGQPSGEHESSVGVTNTETGAKRDSFFRKRDYSG